MRLFILFVLVSSSVQASDCVTRMANLALAIKLKTILISEIYGDDGVKSQGKAVNRQDMCRNSKSKDMWTEDQAGKAKFIKIIKADLKNKKKTSANFFADFDDDSGKEELTEADICKLLDKKIASLSQDECSEKVFYEGLIRKSILNSTFEEVCMDLAPAAERNHEASRNCENKAVVREAPGDEIAPAEDHNVTIVPPKSRSEVKAEQPAKLRNTSSGASRQ